MGANAATKAQRVVENTERVLAIELMAAFQALEFQGINKTSSKLQKLFNEYRKHVDFVENDIVMYEYMDKSLNFVKTSCFKDYL